MAISLGCTTPSTPSTPPSAGGQHATASPSTQVTDIADAYLAALLAWQPTRGYFIDRPPQRHDAFENNGLEALAAWEATEDNLLEQLRTIEHTSLEGTPQWTTYGALREKLEASVQQRICQSHLWSVSQMTGWQVYYLNVARVQPVATADERVQALMRWARLPAFIDTEIALLRQGITAGYSAPKSNVRRVVEQLDRYLQLPLNEDPFIAMGAKTDDGAFKLKLASLVTDSIRPAIKRYRAYLQREYLPAARTSLSITTNPNGRACYEAMLRGYTTLKWRPEDIFAIGKRTVAMHRDSVVEQGRTGFGATGFANTLEKVNAVVEDRFLSRDAVIAYARRAVKRARIAMAPYFATLPADAAVVEPYPPHLDGTGVSSRYEAPKGDGPGTYWIAVNDFNAARRGREEIVAFHETYPGHHLQIALEQRLKSVHPVARVTRNSAFIEGWARYAEALAEEMGLYETKTAPIFRRAWPARGMVVDPGIHVMGWDREKAVAFIMESGRFDRVQADNMVDRIATIPGQLTSYDSGALEIFALRKLAKATLQERFDIKIFHERILENGTIPLWMLRTHIERWLQGSSPQ